MLSSQIAKDTQEKNVSGSFLNMTFTHKFSYVKGALFCWFVKSCEVCHHTEVAHVVIYRTANQYSTVAVMDTW